MRVLSSLIDIANDVFELEATSDDGACITGVLVNGNQLLFGKNSNLLSFWLEIGDEYCLDDVMSTSRITIQNGHANSVCNQLMNHQL